MKQKTSTPVGSKDNHLTSSSKRFKIICTSNFLTEATNLKKKYPNIHDDFMELRDQLRKDPITGNDYMTQDVYKVRMPISDKSSGQRGGARVIIQVKIIDKVIYVLSVYDKSDAENILDTKLKKLLNGVKKLWGS